MKNQKISCGLPGWMMLLLYVGAFSVCLVVLKLLYKNGELLLSEINGISAAFQLVFSLVIHTGVLHLGHKHKRVESMEAFLANLLMTGVFVLANIARQIAVAFAPAGNCAALMGLLPLIIGLTDMWMHGTPLSKSFILCSIVTLSGTFLTLAPSTDAQKQEVENCSFGYILMALSVFCYSLFTRLQHSVNIDMYVLTRDSSACFLALFGFYCALQICTEHKAFSSVSGLNLGLIAIHGVCRVIAGLALTEGTKQTKPVLAGMIIILEIPFTFVLESFIIYFNLDIKTICGVGLIVGSTCFYKYYNYEAINRNDIHHFRTTTVSYMSYMEMRSDDI